jgi:oxygen-independent coproporphyrinogen-3 oxidase
MVQDGLARWEGAKLVVEPMGRLLVRNLAMVFDARLATSHTPTQFSRTI